MHQNIFLRKMNESAVPLAGIIIIVSVSFAVGWNHYVISPQYHQSFARSSQTMKLSNNTKYCFHFTWMGGNFNNRTFRNIQNKTCSQYFKDKKTLCINPMVATYTGGEPDTEYILEHHATAATCRVSQEQVCAKYTVYHNGIVSYQTRYCTQINIDLEGAMQTGCIQEKRGNELIQVCACMSEPGPSGICNAGFQSFSFDLTSVLILSTIYLLCVYI